MSEYNLGTARGVIELDYQGKGAAEAASRDIEGIKGKSQSADQALSKVGTGALVAGTAIAGGFAVAISAAANFEKGLSGIEAVSGATQGEMEAVRKKALQLGADTAFSASESATAMEELVKAGISIPDVLNGAADSVVALAAAGGVDLPQAATIASNAMNQFGLAADKMPGIADKIAGAANSSAIDVSDFGMSLSAVGAVANAIGLTFDDTAVAIAALGNAGIKGSDAGTSLKAMLLNLQPTTKKQTELMKELGLVTADGANQFFDATGKIKPMSEIAGTLQKALAGMGDAQRTAALETLFGSDAIRAAAVIAENGSAGFDKLSGAIDKTKAADVAATRLDNMAGKVDALKGSAETLAIQFGSILLPALTSLVQKVTEAINWFTSLSATQQKSIVTALAIAAGVLLLVGTIVKMVQAVQAIRAAWIALNATFLLSPIGIIIGLIIALIAILIYAYTTNDEFRANVQKVWAAIKAAIGAVVDWITGTMVPFLVNAWKVISSAAVTAWSAIQGAISAVVTWITGTAIPFIQSAWTAIVAGATWLWNMIVTVFQAILLAVTLPMRAILTVIQTVMAAAQSIWTAVWGLFGPLVTAVFELIKAVIQLALAWIGVAIQTALNGIKAVWSAIWNGIKTVIDTVMSAIRTAISTYVNAYKTVITTVFNAIKSVITTVMNGIKSVISSIWGVIGGTVTTAVNNVKSVVTTGFNAAKTAAANAFNSLKNAVSTAINAVYTTVSGVVSRVQGVFNGAGSWLYEAGKKIIQGLIDGIRAMIGSVTSAISGVTDKIRGFLPGSPIKEGPLKEHGWNEGRPGQQLMASVADGIGDNVNLIARAMRLMPSEVPISLTAPDVALAGSASRMGGHRTPDKAASAPVGALRMVEGTLGIDPSGRAYIQGLATEVVDARESFSGTTERMSGF